MAHQNVERAGAAHCSAKSYLVGFILAALLTLAAFGLVMHPVMSPSATLRTVLLLAVVQVFVHLVYFLHLNRSSEQRWNVLVVIFFILIIAIVVVGSLWIMMHLNHNMMRL